MTVPFIEPATGALPGVTAVPSSVSVTPGSALGSAVVVVQDSSRVSDQVLVQRITPGLDGVNVIVEVRNGRVAATAATATATTGSRRYEVTDYEAPVGAKVWYRAALRTAGTASTYGAFSAFSPFTDTTTDWLLSDPLNAASAQVITPEYGDVTISYPRARGVFTPLRGTREIVMTGPLRGAVFDLPLIVTGAAAWTALAAKLAAGKTLLVRHGLIGSVYAAPGDSIEVTVVGYAGDTPVRKVQLSVTEVAAP
jgi:hypothetical protein